VLDITPIKVLIACSTRRRSSSEGSCGAGVPRPHPGRRPLRM